MTKKPLLFIALLLLASSSYAQVFINEICPANADINYDSRFYNFSGWVELYNSGTSSVNLSGYLLSDKSTEQAKWKLPSGTSISSKGYLLIWCDDMNTGLHTNFSLDSDGEDVVLSTPALLVVDKITFPKQRTNISYGRISDGGSSLGFMVSPTPNAKNSGSNGTEDLESPQFSIASGRYSSTQSLSLTHAKSGVTIRFTTDGSEPTVSSTAFSNPISVSTTSVIKAKAFQDNFIPSKTVVASYFINEHTFTLPVVSISTKPNYLWDNTIGIYTDGTNGIPGNCVDSPKNWNQDWDRHATIEYFKPNGERIFDQAVDIRIGGACSRGNPQKSFAVKARDKYGKKVIEEKLFDTKDANEYGGFMLRNSGNDFWYTMFRDALLQSLTIGQMDVDYMAYQPAAFYLNGEYWGVQNLREKIDADYIESNYGIKKDDLDLIETWGNALEGTPYAYENYINGLQQIDITDPASFEYIDSHIDVQEFINYLSAEIYYANTDWPGNNIKLWRKRSTNGKFRWILWDTDFGFGLYDWASYPTHPTLDFATDPNSGVDWPNPPWSTLHIRLLMQNPVFRNRFIATLTTAMSTTFHPDRVVQMINSFREKLKDEMPLHKQRWGGNDWSSEVQKLRDFAISRNVFMQQHVADYFGLGEKVKINVTSSPANVSAFEFNGVTNDNAIVDASYFKGLPLTVKPKPHDGYVFKSWKIKKRESTSLNMISLGDTWKYFDQGSTPASWNTEAFNDATWAQGPAELGYGDGGERTVVGFGGSAGNKFITTYFRKKFTANITGIEDATASVRFDDGIVVYLNGTEVYRNNMPGGTIDMSTLAVDVVDPDATATFTIDKDLFKSGDNVIAVEVHQISAGSSDISFDLELHSVKLGAETETTSDDLVFSDTAVTDITIEALFELGNPVSGIVINEFAATGSWVRDEFNEESDWIELYNTGSSVVDLAGLYVTDNLANKTKFKIPEGVGNETVIQPGEYKLLWADEEMHQGALHVNFKLSAEGESIGLFQVIASNTTVIDQLTYTAQDDFYSSARIPNGTGPFLATGGLTPGSENLLATGIADEETSYVVVYPNPTLNSVTVKSDKIITTISVYDIYGRLLNNIPVNDFSKELSLLDKNTGMYVLKIESHKGMTSAKVVKK